MSCTECPYKNNTVVPPQGPNNAAIILIGDAPNASDEKYKEPFMATSGSGKILNMLLASAGIDRRDCYTTTVMKCRPPRDDIELARKNLSAHYCTQLFQKELTTLTNPKKILVPMGKLALEALNITHPLADVRGFRIDTPYGLAIPTLSPNYIMKMFHEYITGVYDWKKIHRLSRQLQPLQLNENFYINPTVNEIVDYIDDIIGEARRSPDILPVGYDLETFKVENPMQTPIKLVGIAKSSTTAMSIPLIDQGGFIVHKDSDALKIIYALLRFFNEPKIELVAHNTLFDILVTMNAKFPVLNKIYDTMLAKMFVYHPTPNSLAYATSIYADYFPWKLQENDRSDKNFRTYNCRDAAVLLRIKPELDKDLDHNNARYVFNNIMKVIVPTVQMTLNGIYVDVTRQKPVSDRMHMELEGIARNLRELCQDPGFNPESPKQLANVLFKKLKLKSGIKTAKGAQSTDKTVLNKLAIRYPQNEFIHKMLHYREIGAIVKTFVDPPILADGRVHSTFKLTVITGRYSSSNPNIMNFPKRAEAGSEIRWMYTAGPGRVFVTPDFKQAELRIIAQIAQDEPWLHEFATGGDPHKNTGISLTGEYEEKFRTFYKNFNFGFIYGSEGDQIEAVAPKALIQRISVPRMIANFKRAHPALFEYRASIESSIKTLHRVSNPFGRTRYFPGTVSKKMLREGYNFPIQSTIADIMHIKMAMLWDEIKSIPDWKIVLQLHDAIFIEVPENAVRSAASMLRDIMEHPVTAPTGMTFKLPCDMEAGPSLKELSKV